MFVAASKTQFIVNLQIIWKPKALPTSQQAGGDMSVSLCSLRFDVNAMTVKIHHIECVKSAVTLYVAWTDKISLVNVVKVNSLGKIRILNPFGNVSCFF